MNISKSNNKKERITRMAMTEMFAVAPVPAPSIENDKKEITEQDLLFTSLGVTNNPDKYVVYKHNYTEKEETNDMFPIVFNSIKDADKYFEQYLKDRDLIDRDHHIYEINGFDTGNEWFEVKTIKQYI